MSGHDQLPDIVTLPNNKFEMTKWNLNNVLNSLIKMKLGENLEFVDELKDCLESLEAQQLQGQGEDPRDFESMKTQGNRFWNFALTIKNNAPTESLLLRCVAFRLLSIALHLSNPPSNNQTANHASSKTINPSNCNLKLCLQFMSMAIKILRGFLAQNDLKASQLWALAAKEWFLKIQSNLAKDSANLKSGDLTDVSSCYGIDSETKYQPIDPGVQMGIFTYRLTIAWLVWVESKQAPNDSAATADQSATCFRIVQDAIQDLDPALSKSIKVVQTVYQACSNLAALSKKSQEKQKWLAICLKKLDDLSLSTFPSLISLKKQVLLAMLSDFVERKMVTDAQRILHTGKQLLEGDSVFHCLHLELLSLQKAAPLEFKKAFEVARTKCFSSNQNKQNGVSNLIGLIHLVSKHAGYTIALDCLTDTQDIISHDPSLSKLGWKGLLEGCTPSSSLLILSLYLMVENRVPDGPSKAKLILESKSMLLVIFNLSFVELDHTPETRQVALLMLWKAGDAFASCQSWSIALEWYALSLQLLSSTKQDSDNKAILFRKMGYCYYELNDFEKGIDCCIKSAGLVSEHKSTEYLFFLLYASQDDFAQASTHLLTIPFESGSSFYVSATDIATSKGRKDIVLQILKKSVGQIKNPKPRLDVLSVLRQLIHLSILELQDAQVLQEKTPQDINQLVQSLSGYMKMTFSLLESMLIRSTQSTTSSEDNNGEVLMIELESFFRFAWNASLLIYSVRPSSLFDVSLKCFDLVLQTGQLFSEISLQALYRENIELSLFLCAWLSLQQSRSCPDTSTRDHITKTGLNYLALFKMHCSESSKSSNSDSGLLLLKALYIEFELLCLANAWDKVLSFVKENAETGSHDLWTRCSDLVVLMDGVPFKVILECVSKTLSALHLYQDPFDFRLYIKWSRVLIQAHLSCSQVESPTQDLLAFISNLCTLLGTTSSSRYSAQDVLWITVSLWNKGTEIWAAGLLQDAQEWLESSLKVAAFCNTFDVSTARQLEEIRKLYTEFLALLDVDGDSMMIMD